MNMNKIVENINNLPTEMQEQILMCITHPFDNIRLFKKYIKIVENSRKKSYKVKFLNITLMTVDTDKKNNFDIFLNSKYFGTCKNEIVVSDPLLLFQKHDFEKLYLQIDEHMIKLRSENEEYLQINNNFEVSVHSSNAYVLFSGIL